MKALGSNSPGDYSITRLIMDFSTTMCIGSSVFFDNFLIRSMSGNNGEGLFGRLNAGTWIDALGCTAKFGISCESTWKWGQADHDPTFYDWQCNALDWVWHQSTKESAKDKPVEGFDAETSIEISGVTSVRIHTNIMTLGVSQHGSYVPYPISFTENSKLTPYPSSTVKTAWEFTMSADSILAGGLQLNMNLPASDSDLFKTTVENDQSFFQRELKEVALSLEMSSTRIKIREWLRRCTRR
ncbi:MAG: hypothetical protein Q9203_004734 [Teloschistes exilis]